MQNIKLAAKNYDSEVL